MFYTVMTIQYTLVSCYHNKVIVMTLSLYFMIILFMTMITWFHHYSKLLFSFACLRRARNLKGTVSRDFRPSAFFIKQSPLGPLFMG
jgi:hypothetical protein